MYVCIDILAVLYTRITHEQIIIDRYKHKRSRKQDVINKCTHHLCDGGNLVVYGEGGMSVSCNQMARLIISYFEIAKKVKCYIQPVVIDASKFKSSLIIPSKSQSLIFHWLDIIDPSNFETAEIMRNHVQNAMESKLKS